MRRKVRRASAAIGQCGASNDHRPPYAGAAPGRRDDPQEGQGWGYGMSVAVEKTPSGAPAGAIGWVGGFGSKWQSDPAQPLTAILLSQRLFDDAKPASIFDTFEQDAIKSAE
ncbi:MAG: serine hydrolase [Methyloceanibacter sp.]